MLNLQIGSYFATSATGMCACTGSEAMLCGNPTIVAKNPANIQYMAMFINALITLDDGVISMIGDRLERSIQVAVVCHGKSDGHVDIWAIRSVLCCPNLITVVKRSRGIDTTKASESFQIITRVRGRQKYGRRFTPIIFVP
jgi:hypothetical protein